MNTITVNDLKIDQVRKDVFYIHLGNLVVYIDNSTGENIVSKWIESNMLLTAENIHETP